MEQNVKKRKQHKRKDGKDAVMKLTRCPVCGGKLYIDSLYQYSIIHEIRKDGKISERYRKVDYGPMESKALYCENQDFKTDYDMVVTEPKEYAGVRIKTYSDYFLL